MEKQTIHNKNKHFFCYRKSRKHLFQVTSAYSKIFADDLGPYTLMNAKAMPDAARSVLLMMFKILILPFARA